ncbi:hypothetical protein EYF80_018878 [Liparis tanakae]|uniref:Uncharacterized protein n=1 Tax=Liparis tanakae TaxID=230148 RepID=A0A4Z2I0Z5_9TELE|nr:hypothetical protein EYF80_018878 [Liparis tanakae]
MNLRPAECTTCAVVLGEMPERKAERKFLAILNSQPQLNSLHLSIIFFCQLHPHPCVLLEEGMVQQPVLERKEAGGSEGKRTFSNEFPLYLQLYRTRGPGFIRPANTGDE